MFFPLVCSEILKESTAPRPPHLSLVYDPVMKGSPLSSGRVFFGRFCAVTINNHGVPVMIVTAIIS